jgi:hypothetical protein
MRRRASWAAAVAVALSAALLGAAAPAPSASAPSAPPAGSSSPDALQLSVDRSKVDLKGHRLEVTASREVSKVTYKVLGESGTVLARDEVRFAGRPAGSVLVVTWTPSSDETVARIELVAHDTQGYWAGIALIPWSVSVPHQEVLFRTGSAQIDDPEKPKLEASFTKLQEILAKHHEIGTITVFIAGHTDTVGRADANLKLSQRRAQAIASWFRQRGLKNPIAYEGFGESALLVKTPDETNEPRNRRVDYILSLAEPVIQAVGFRATWKRVD